MTSDLQAKAGQALCLPPASNAFNFRSWEEIDDAGIALSQASPTNMLVAGPVQKYREFRMRCLATSLSVVEAAHPPTRVLVSVRLKRLVSIHRKLARESKYSISRLNDIVGIRVVCQTLEDVTALSDRIKSSCAFPCEVKDNIRGPENRAKTGYRAIHHILNFEQPLSEISSLRVGFEIQVKSFLQHQWAIWQEKHGDNVKAGYKGGEPAEEHLEDIRALKHLSERIARWENSHPDKIQKDFPSFVGRRNIAVVWRSSDDIRPGFAPFRNIGPAIERLNYLEAHYAAEPIHALLLVGVSDESAAEKVLRMTHPIYVTGKAAPPEEWMPPDS